MERAVLVPVEAGSAEATLRLADWYAAHLKLPGDRLVFVSVLVPALGPTADADSGCVGGGGDDDLAGAAAGSDLSIESVGDDDAGCSPPRSPLEATMERQLAESVRREERLAGRLKARGCASFRYIHAFGRSHAGTLARIAAEQRARLLLASFEAMTADCDVGYAFRLFRRARLAVHLVPDPPPAGM